MDELNPLETERVRLAMEQMSSPFEGELNPAFIYVPPSHAKALDFDATVIEGPRGAGKSFWWHVLGSDTHRHFVAKAYPETQIAASMRVLRGFGGLLDPMNAPSRDVLASLQQALHPPRAIWRAVLGRRLNFPLPFPQDLPDRPASWAACVAWVDANPEAYDMLLIAADKALEQMRSKALIVFDALDQLADDWTGMRPLARALLQLAQDVRGTRCIRFKVFLRPDMLQDVGMLGFPDASKLLARRAYLGWRRADLFAMFFQRLGNSPVGGQEFRYLTEHALNLVWRPGEGSWLIPSELRLDEARQQQLFEHLAGKTMAASPNELKRGRPYLWLSTHLKDGRDEISPRTFLAALRRAAEYTQEHFADHSLPLHFQALRAGVVAASQFRAYEFIYEDYAWVAKVMTPLRGQLVVPCTESEILGLWRHNGVLDELHAEKGAMQLPPRHLSDGLEGILGDLQQLGVLQRLLDGRYQMPDVYRIVFGVGRRGGVKPVR